MPPAALDGSIWVTRMEMDKVTHRQTLHLKRLEPHPLERSLTLRETTIPPEGKGEYRQVKSASVTADGKHVLFALERVEAIPRPEGPPGIHYTGECRLEWWDVEEGRRAAVWNQGTDEVNLLMADMVADGRYAVTQSEAGIKVWNADTGKVEHSWPVASPMLGGVIFTPDRKHLLRYRNGELRNGFVYATNTVLDIHEISSGRLVQNLELRDWSTLNSVTPLAVHLGEGWLAASRQQGASTVLEMWELKTGKLWAQWSPHDGAPFSASFSHDGRLLVTHSERTLRLWPLPLLRRGVEELTRK